MNIYEILNNSKIEKVKGFHGKTERLYKHNLAWFPIADFYNDYTVVYLDFRHTKDILKLIPKIEGDFFCASPIYADPNRYKDEIESYHYSNIRNYLVNYSKKKYYDGFKEIDFDVITNLVRYCKRWDCLLQLKGVYDEVNKTVQSKTYDYYNNTSDYSFPDYVREEFNGLYRQIKLAEILN